MPKAGDTQLIQPATSPVEPKPDSAELAAETVDGQAEQPVSPQPAANPVEEPGPVIARAVAIDRIETVSPAPEGIETGPPPQPATETVSGQAEQPVSPQPAAETLGGQAERKDESELRPANSRPDRDETGLEAGLSDLLELESTATRTTASHREKVELDRRCVEVMQKLQGLRVAIEQEQEGLEAKMHFFSNLLNRLGQLRRQAGQGSLRSLRQAVDGAHLECLKHEREKDEARTLQKSTGQPELSSLSFGQLTRIGSALLWPLILTLLLIGSAIAGAIYISFSIF